MNTRSAHEPRRVLIAGGGIGGLSLALALQSEGWEPWIVEKRSREEMLSGPGGIYIQLNALTVLRHLEEGRLCQRLFERGGAVLRGGFYTDQASPLYLNDPAFVGRDNLGICLSRSALQELLVEGIPEERILCGSGLEELQADGAGVRVTLQDGRQLQGDLLVGADGLWSKVRSRLEGRSRAEPPEYSGYTCWRGLLSLPCEALHGVENSWAEYWGKGLRFGWFHVGQGQQAFYAFQNTEARGEDQRPSLELLRELFADFADPVPAILDALEGEPIYRDDICDRIPLGAPWGQGPVTLLGDAAHPVQPNIGQGACQAIEDGFELVQALRRARHEQSDLEAALRAYELSRQARVRKVWRVSRQVGELAQSETAFGCFLRNQLYRWMPNWLGDMQFRWLFGYEAQRLDFPTESSPEA